MKKRLLSILLALAMVVSTFASLPVLAAEPNLELSDGSRSSYSFDQSYTGLVNISFDLETAGSGYFWIWLFSEGKAGSENGSNPDFQVANNGVWVQNSSQIYSVSQTEVNHIEMLIDLAQKQYTVAVNDEFVSAPITFTGDLENIAGFDYRTNNGKTATVSNLTVEAKADTSVQITEGTDSQIDFDKGYTGKVKVGFDLKAVKGGDGNVNINFFMVPFGGDRLSAANVIQLSGAQFCAQQASATDRRVTFDQFTHVEFVYDLANSQYTVSVDGGEPAGPYAASGTQENVGGLAFKANKSGNSVIDNVTVEKVLEPTELEDITASSGAQEYSLDSAYIGDVKVSFNLTSQDGINATLRLYPMADSYYPATDLNLQVDGVKLWAQSAESAGRLTAGESGLVEIYYTTGNTSYALYLNGEKQGDYTVGALSDIGKFAYGFRTSGSGSTGDLSITNVKVENAKEPEEGGGEEPEGPYEYDNTGFDLPVADENATYPTLIGTVGGDVKKADRPLGGDFKGTAEDPVTIEFDLEIKENFAGATIGYGDSRFEDVVSHWSDMGVMIQFLNQEEYPEGNFNIRNGGNYDDTGFDWEVGVSHFKVAIDTQNKTCDVWYTAPGAEEAVQVADDAAYRTESANLTDSIGLMTFEGTAAEESVVIRNHKVYGKGYSYVAPASEKVVEPERTEPTTLTVGPNGQFATLAKALAKAISGDTIEIDAAGDYLGLDSNASINLDDITIRGVNGRPVIGYPDRSGEIRATAGKGIWVGAGKNLTVENIEFQNAHDAKEADGNNYCGIRLEPVADSTVTIKNCYFHGNDNGVLVGKAEGMTVKMQNCEFDDNGFGQMMDGHYSTQEHGMYMGEIENFYFEQSISRNIKAQGHLIKTRAANNYIRYSYIAEETTAPDHSSNSNIDIPEGGNLYVIGNVLHQGLTQPNVGNPRMISYAAESGKNPGTMVVFANNTIINDQIDAAQVNRSMINLHTNKPEGAEYDRTFSTENVIFVNNVYQGYLDDGVAAVVKVVNGEDMTAAVFTAENGNHIYDLSKADDAEYAAANDPKFVDPANYDYRLQEGSPLIDKGVVAEEVNGVSLIPAYQPDMAVIHGTRGDATKGSIATERSIVGDAIDIGAFEYGNIAPAKVYQVGPNRQYKNVSEVVDLLQPGDIVEVDGGYDYNDRIIVKRSGTANAPIIIRGVGDEKPNFSPVVTQQSNGICVIQADYVILENLKITGDVYRDLDDPDWGNTSHDGKPEDGLIFRGIFNRGDHITIRNCDVSHCAQGIQSANDLAGSLTVEYSNIHENGRGWGEHNLYIATNNEKYPDATLTFQYNYVHDANCDSNGLKSRALNNRVYYNWFENNSQEFELISMNNDEATLRGYESSNDVVGNVFVKTMDGRFCYQLGRFGGDGTGAGSFGRYRFANNTFAMLRNDFDWNYGALRLHMGIESVEVYNNVFYAPNLSEEWPMKIIDPISPNWASGEALVYGANNWVSEGSYLPGDLFVDKANPEDKGTILPGEFVNTIEGVDPGFVDAENMDFRLTEQSPLINAGTADTVKTWDDWTNGDYSNKNNQIQNPLTAVTKQPINKADILAATTSAPSAADRASDDVIDIGAYEYDSTVAGSVVYQVGPDRQYKTVSEVVDLLNPGDIVEVDGGYDYNELVTIRRSGTADAPIIIRGVGDEKPNFAPSVSKRVNGIFVVEADNVILENLKITGDVYRDMDDPDWGNTKADSSPDDFYVFRGIFNAGNDITIRNCDISHCCQGIQSHNNLAGNLIVEYCNVHENGAGWGEHNMYIATNNEKYPYATLTARYNYIHDANCDSNGLKTRALNNRVYYNWFENNSQEFELISMSGEEILRSRESSGDVVGNVFVKTMDARFPGQLCRFGGDGTGEGSFGRYRFANNTFALLRNDNFDWNYNTIRLHMGIESVEMYNNVFYAPYVPEEYPIEIVSILKPNWASGERLIYGSNNWVSEGTIVPEEWENTIEGVDPGFVDVENMDFHLTEQSPLINAGTADTVKTWDDWTNGDYSNKNNQIKDPLTASMEPIHKNTILSSATTVPTATARTDEGQVDIGAYGSEFTSTVYEVYPSNSKEEIDAIINGLQPGDTLIFHEGTYNMNLRSVRNSGFAERPIVIKGADGEAKPLIVNDNTEANLWEIYGDNIVIDHMAFQNNVNAGIRLGKTDTHGASGITIQNCTFTGSDEIAVRINDKSAVYDDIKLLNNDFVAVKKTAIYVGDHDGTTSVTGLEVRGNFFDGRDIVDPNVTGYALELKKNVTGAVVENNLFINPKGPAICVYGSDNGGLENANIIRNNITGGSRENSGIIVCAGPAVVQNNIALSNEYIGIGLQDYQSWGMLRDIVMTGNTSAIIYDPTCPDDYTGLAVSNPDKNIVVEDNQFYKELPASVLKKIGMLLDMTERPDQAKVDAAFALLAQKGENEPLTVSELTAILDALVEGATEGEYTVYGKLGSTGSILPNEQAEFVLSIGNLYRVNTVKFELTYDPALVDYVEYELLASNAMIMNFANENGVISGVVVLTQPITNAEFSDLMKVVFVPKDGTTEVRVQVSDLSVAGVGPDNMGTTYETVILTREAVTEVSPFAAYDVNYDGKVDLGDIAELLKYLNWSEQADYDGFDCGCPSGDCYHEFDKTEGLSWGDAVHADVNGDGIVDVVDLTLILSAIQ